MFILLFMQGLTPQPVIFRPYGAAEERVLFLLPFPYCLLPKKKKGKLLISHRYNLNALATFLSWGSYKGADRIRLTRCKNTLFSYR